MKPTLLKAAKTYLEFALEENYPLRFSKAKGRRIACLSGILWITVYNELPDYMLTSGEVFVIPNNGVCVLEAIEHCQVRIDLPSLSGHVLHRLHAFWERNVLDVPLRAFYRQSKAWPYTGAIWPWGKPQARRRKPA